MYFRYFDYSYPEILERFIFCTLSESLVFCADVECVCKRTLLCICVMVKAYKYLHAMDGTTAISNVPGVMDPTTVKYTQHQYLLMIIDIGELLNIRMHE